MDHMRARCARDGLVDGTCDATLNATLATPFYMHTSPDLDHEWLQSCDGFAELRHGPTSEKLAEVGLRVLAPPGRTRHHDARAVFADYTLAPARPRRPVHRPPEPAELDTFGADGGT